MPDYTSHGSTCSIAGSAVGKIKAIGGVGWSREVVDVSNFESTDMWKEYLAGWIDGGEMSLELVNTVTEVTPSGSTSPVAIVVSIGGSATFTFNGIVTGWDISGGSGGEVTASVKIKICGPIATS